MGFWRGLAVRLGIGLTGFMLIALVVGVLSQFTSDTDQIMIYSFILVPTLSISIASGIYIFKK